MATASGFLSGDIASRFKRTGGAQCIIVTNTLAACSVAAEDIAAAAAVGSPVPDCVSVGTLICTVDESAVRGDIERARTTPCVVILATGYCTIGSDELHSPDPDQKSLADG